MEFKQISLRDGTLALSGTGPIVSGDAARLRAALATIPPDHLGARILRLNSPGGSVFESFEMADVIDEMRVMAVVAWDDLCASACASVLFLAADARMLLGNGRLMFHACDPGRSAAENAETLCNADIARFVGEQGFSPDWLFTGLASAGRKQGEHYLTMRSIGCMGMQQPPGLPHQGANPTPCLQLATTGAVQSDRDWDRPPDSAPLREPLPRTATQLRFLHSWSPPDVWSYRIERDGVALGYRRLGRFPDGPELAIMCHYDIPGDLLIHLRHLAPVTAPAAARAQLRIGRVTEQIDVALHYREGPAHISVLRAPATLRRMLNDPLAEIAVTLTDAAGDMLMDLTADWGTGFVRMDIALAQCAGRYPGEP